jgi:hypothetical protein
VIPVWLLDIDGVINACTRNPDKNVWPADQWRRDQVNGYPILIAQPVLDFITRVHEEERAEIRWHTTWQKDAVLIEKAFGLPSLPVQDCPEFADRRYDRDRWFKLPAAERVVMQEGRALVWTDDDIEYSISGKDAGALGVMRQAQRILAISPSDMTGLTPKHLRLIDEFLGGAS